MSGSKEKKIWLEKINGAIEQLLKAPEISEEEKISLLRRALQIGENDEENKKWQT